MSEQSRGKLRLRSKFPNDVPKDFDTATLGWPFFLLCTLAQGVARYHRWA